MYAGIDPLSKKRHYLTETIPAGPTAAKDAEKARTRLLAEVDQRRNPRTRATVNQLIDRYLEVLDVDERTRNGYLTKIQNHIRPVLGMLQGAKVDGEVLDSFYAMLRHCRHHCSQQRRRDREHVCEPLAPSSIRQIHAILSGAFHRAVRWGWLGTNPAEKATPPAPPAANPDPPTPEQAARIAAEAWRDPDWGMFVWMAMVAGRRRGELCALCWDRVNLDDGVLVVRTSIAQLGSRTWEKDVKTHQQSRVALDETTVALLRTYRARRTELAAMLGLELLPGSRVFSLGPDGTTWLKPDSVTQRYSRMCARLGWDTHLHQLHHYSATELVAAGVDVRTVAGRLGHSGGGATTLKVYSAWRSEADQRAAGILAGRMPPVPVEVDQVGNVTIRPAEPDPDHQPPYLRIAADLGAAITCGVLRAGDQLPAYVELASRYEVAESTVHRAVAALAAAGEVEVSRGRRARVAKTTHGSG